MIINGLNKLTLLDYPEHIAATIFLGGCNFRCPFCQNKGLVIAPHLEPSIDELEVFDFLKKRQGLLEGVCITGGEPTLQNDLSDFIKEIKSLGYLIKLDTNGYRPDVLKALRSEGLVDYVAMDIKSSPKGYNTVCGNLQIDLDRIMESVAFLMEDNIDYEFRTTVVKELHSMQDMKEIGKWISGCKRYFLQAYVESENVLAPGYSSYTKDEMMELRDVLRHYLQHVELRGISHK